MQEVLQYQIEYVSDIENSNDIKLILDETGEYVLTNYNNNNQSINMIIILFALLAISVILIIIIIIYKLKIKKKSNNVLSGL